MTALACHTAAPVESTPARPPVAVQVISPGTVAGWLTVPATLKPSQAATISTHISSRVRRVLVREGDQVHAGDLLVDLWDDDLRSQLRAAEAAAATATAQERRLAHLFQDTAATRSELETAQAIQAQTQATVAAAQESLRYTELRAPFAGRVQAKLVTVGDLVTPGAPLIELSAPGLELQASLDEKQLAGVHLGDILLFESDDREGRVQITALAPGADPVTHRVDVRALVAAPAEGFRAGGYAQLRLPSRAGVLDTTLWVPSSAVVQRGDLRGVFVAEGGRADLRWLLLGDTVGAQVPVRDGLHVGSTVIDAPGALRDGQAIEVAHGNR